MLTRKRLKEVLRYEPDSGLFVWIVRISKKIKKGQTAGSLGDRGYLKIKIDGSIYYAHRLAWLYMTGLWPTKLVDHKDGDKGNNRWNNLRNATKSINAQNQKKACRNNTTGFLGVSPAGRKFKAQICLDGNLKYIGSFPTPHLAYSAYLNEKRTIHTGNTL
jgi:hypothetical protein